MRFSKRLYISFNIIKEKIFLTLFLLFFLPPSSIWAEKIYIDINQPGIKKLTIALEGFDRIPVTWETIKNNLEFTEYFKVYGPFPYKEDSFNPSLWKATDVEIVIRGKTDGNIGIKIFTTTLDKPIFAKDYPLKNDESTGNLISADIFKLLTGKDSPFFNRFVFLRKFKDSTGIFLSNWNGKNIYDTGIRREIISRVILRGNRIFYSSLEKRNWQIEVFELSSKTNREILKSRALLQLGDVIGDSQIIYLQNDGDLSEIKIMDISGKVKTLTSSRWVESSPRLFGSKIIFVSNRAGSPQIYEMTEGGLGLRRLTFQGRYNTEPSVSPDGSKLALSSLIGNFQIFVIDFTTGSQIQVTNEGNNEQPSFCPDGNFITIMSDRRGKREIFLVSSDGLVQKPLTNGYLPYCSR